ncbi:MAG: triose-phosphate isomerase [Thermodesulfobacteriota bacterium]|nr:triose-phosphate isomerase [Thermodesulfobacteriota bacterium]
MIKPMIAANWKMHKEIPEAVGLANQLKKEFFEPGDVDIVIAPPFTALWSVMEALKDSPIHMSAQNMHWEEKGAYTGEISATMLVDAGCEFVIIGHSERRTLFGETGEILNKKVRAALKSGLKPIFCIGETLEERESGATFEVVQEQIKEGLNNIASDDIRGITLAYEPIWAIGTGKTATPLQAQEVHRFIRETIAVDTGYDLASETLIIYGGSVNPENTASLMDQPDINGALVGGASLDFELFAEIIKISKK